MAVRPARAGIWLTCLLLLAACSRPGPAPDTPAPVAEPPQTSQTQPAAPSPAPAAAPQAPPAVTGGTLLRVWAGYHPPLEFRDPGTYDLVRGGTPIAFQLTLPAGWSVERVRAALQVTGADPLGVPQLRHSPENWTVSHYLDGGQPGDVVVITVQGPDPAPIVVRISRRPDPTVRITAWRDGQWQPVAAGDTLPPGPLRLRYSFAGLPAARLAEAIQPEALQKHLTAVDGQTMELSTDQPPPLISLKPFKLGAGEDGRILPVSAEMPVYVGEAPRLLRRTAAGGDAGAVGPAPSDVLQAAVSPDARYAALLTHAGDGWEEAAVWVSDLQTGQLWNSGVQCTDCFWRWLPGRPARLLVAAAHRISVIDPAARRSTQQHSTGVVWAALSPDGRYLAGDSGARRGRGTGGYNGASRMGTLVVADLQAGAESAFPWDGYRGRMSWAPDGSLLVSTTADARVEQTPEGITWEGFRVDAHTGARTAFAGRLPVAPGGPGVPDWAASMPDPAPLIQRLGEVERFLAWLPDGQALVLHWQNYPYARPLLP